MNEEIARPLWLEMILPEVKEIDLSDSDRKYRIGDLAKEFDVTLRTLRFYEDRGLITPERSGAQRLYSEQDRARLKVILLAKRVGFSLVEIDEIMDLHDNKPHDHESVEKLIEMFRNQRANLVVQQSEIVEAVDRLEETITALENSKSV